MEWVLFPAVLLPLFRVDKVAGPFFFLVCYCTLPSSSPAPNSAGAVSETLEILPCAKPLLLPLPSSLTVIYTRASQVFSGLVPVASSHGQSEPICTYMLECCVRPDIAASTVLHVASLVSYVVLYGTTYSIARLRFWL